MVQSRKWSPKTTILPTILPIIIVNLNFLSRKRLGISFVIIILSKAAECRGYPSFLQNYERLATSCARNYTVYFALYKILSTENSQANNIFCISMKTEIQY